MRPALGITIEDEGSDNPGRRIIHAPSERSLRRRDCTGPRMAGSAILAAVTILGGAAHAQQQAGVELRIESRSLEEGEIVEASLVCTNTGDPSLPEFSVPDGLNLQVTNPTPFRSSMTSIINGRRTDTSTATFPMRLTARKAGSYVLGPITVEAGGTTYQSNVVPITVRKGDASSQRDGDKLVFARMSVQPVSLYVTQSLEATLTFGIRKFEMNGRVVELGNLLQLVDGGGSDLSVFGTRFTPSENTMTDSSGTRHPYVVYRQSREIRAEQVGALQVGAVFLKVNYPVSLRRSWLGGYEVAESRREIARADAINVEVKGPPAEGRPPDFTGAIGHYEFSTVARPPRVEQGQPVTLSLVIKGDPLEGIAGPDLSRYPELASRFDFAHDELTGEIEGQARVFRRAIFPKQLGEQTVPPLTWSYFDPRTERYVSLTTDAIPLTVDPPTSHSTAGGSSDRPPGESSTTLTVLSGGISPNYVNPKIVLKDQSFTMGAISAVGALAAPPAFFLLMMLVSRRRMRLRTDPAFARRLRAGRTARDRVRQALSAPDAARQLDGLAEAMTRFLSDHFALPPGELTPGDVRALLHDRAGEAMAEEVAGFLESCDAIRFAPGASDGVSSREAAARVQQWIARMDKAVP